MSNRSSKKANHARKLNGSIGATHVSWGGKIMQMQINHSNSGVDLRDNRKIVEVKFKLRQPGNSQYHPTYAVREQQLDYEGKRRYWGFGIYEFDRPVLKINTTNLHLIEKHITSREFWITEWNWIMKYPPHHVWGETELTKWEYTFRYPCLKELMPFKTKTFHVEKGTINLTKGVLEKDFDNILTLEAPF